MIQILGLRSFTTKEGKTKNYDAFHEKEWRAKSLLDLFENIDEHIEKIPEKDRWNIFYTVNNCTEDKRDFLSNSVIYFDIDSGIDKQTGRDKGQADIERWSE